MPLRKKNAVVIPFSPQYTRKHLTSIERSKRAHVWNEKVMLLQAAINSSPSFTEPCILSVDYTLKSIYLNVCRSVAIAMLCFQEGDYESHLLFPKVIFESAPS